MKSFFLILFYYQDTGFLSDGKKYINSNYINLLKILFSKQVNKYEKILILRNIIFKILSTAYFPVSIILRRMNYRIYPTTANSIGSYFEQLEMALSDKRKIIILSPHIWCANPYIESILFRKKFLIIKNNFLCFFLIPFTFLKNIRLTYYDLNKNLINQKQYFNNCLNNDLQYEHETIFKHSSIDNFKNTIKKFNIDINKVSKYINLNTSINLGKKICVIHLRDEKNNEIRNTSIENYIDTVNYLAEKKYEVLIFSDQRFKTNNESIKFFNLSEKNKKIQIYSIILSKIYLGPISGPFHVAKFFNKNLIITDCVIFNHYIYHNNFNIIYKKYKRDNRILALSEIFKNNLECIWNSEVLKDQKIEIFDNSSDEILNSTKEFLENKNYEKFNYEELKKIANNKLILKNIRYLMLRNLSTYYIKKNLHAK